MSDALPVLVVQDGAPMADSRDVATTFGRQHKDVLRAIREAHCSPEFRQSNFAPFKTNDLTGETTSHVMMTRDGFSFVVLGFTGAAAARFKEAFLARFNAMEAELRGRNSHADPVAALSDPATLRGLLLDYAGRTEALTARVEALEPKAEALDRIATATGSLCVADAAKALQMGPRALAERLEANRWAFRRKATGSLVPFQSRVDAGDLKLKVHRIPGNTYLKEQTMVTPKGLARLAEMVRPSMFGNPAITRREGISAAQLTLPALPAPNR